MDYATMGGATLGRSLTGIGLNLLSRDAGTLAQFVAEVFGLAVVRSSKDFALVLHQGQVIQFHSDAAFAGHPLLDLLPENPPRGAGVQVYLFGTDPDLAASRAVDAGGILLEPPRDKPHGLREATILSPEGHAFTAARVLEEDA